MQHWAQVFGMPKSLFPLAALTIAFATCGCARPSPPGKPQEQGATRDLQISEDKPARVSAEVIDQQFRSADGEAVEPARGVQVGTKFVVKVRFKLPDREPADMKPIIAQIHFDRGAKGKVLMQSALGKPVRADDGSYQVEVPLSAFDRPGSYELEVGSQDVRLIQSPLIITKPS